MQAGLERFVSGDELIASGTGTASSAEPERDLMARALAALFVAGATLALLTIALPHSRRASELGLLVIVGVAYCVGAGLYWWAGTLPRWVLPIALLLGSTLIAGVAYFSGENPSPLSFFYLWVFLYAAYFLTPERRPFRSSMPGWPTAPCSSPDHRRMGLPSGGWLGWGPSWSRRC